MNKEQDQKVLEELIDPWVVGYCEQYSRNFYYNPLTEESLWELPKDLQLKVQKFQVEYEKEKKQQEQTEKKNVEPNLEIKETTTENSKNDVSNESKLQEKNDKTEQIEQSNNLSKFLSLEAKKKLYKPDMVGVMQKPARKQVEQLINSKVAYRQGDEEYNIWYDKFLSDGKQSYKEREAARTRCDPELDSGYTKADLLEKNNSYFCIHFAKGQCVEGANCKYYHRIPSVAECQIIDQSRDIFGRERYSSIREDMGGVGSFMHETRTIWVSEFKMPHTQNALQSMYEILYRHFSCFGDIEDITVLPNKTYAFIRFQHRCQAEFAKLAMMNQALDGKEKIFIRWAATDNNLDHKPQEKKRIQQEDSKLIQKAMEQRHKSLQEIEQQKMIQASRDKLMTQKIEESKLQQAKEIARKQDIQNNISMMNDILNQIEQNKEEDQKISEKNN